MRLTRSSAVLAMFPRIIACGGLATSVDGGAGGRAQDGADTMADDAFVADVSSAFCEERTRAASALLLAAERSGNMDLSCQTNDDCKVVWRMTSCSDNCSTLTTRAIEEKIDAAIEEADATVCPS